MLRLGVALGIGLLVGFERGWEKRETQEGGRIAGIRIALAVDAVPKAGLVVVIAKGPAGARVATALGLAPAAGAAGYAQTM